MVASRPVPISRDDAIRILDDGKRELARSIDLLSDQELVRAATLGGGDWSVKDLIGHVAAWERRATDALVRWRAGEPVEALASDAGVDAFNARSIALDRTRTLGGVRADAGVTHE